MLIQLVDELTTLGFSERIAQAYVLLAQRGEMTARDIGERFSLARPTAHDVMMSLVHHGLARVKSNGKEKTFVLGSPMVIRERLEEQRRICASKLERFESLLPNLQALASLGGGLCSAVRYIEGTTPVTDARNAFALLPGDSLAVFARGDQRSANITHGCPSDMFIQRCKEIRVIPRAVLSVSGEMRVCADRVLLLSSGGDPTAIEIRSITIADVCRVTLELAWHTAGKIEEWMK